VKSQDETSTVQIYGKLKIVYVGAISEKYMVTLLEEVNLSFLFPYTMQETQIGDIDRQRQLSLICKSETRPHHRARQGPGSVKGKNEMICLVTHLS
jgi:hypothetical protein